MRNSGVWGEMLAYDWVGSKFVKPFKRSDPITIGDVIVTTGTKTEEPRDRKLRFLRQLKLTCMSCTMCSLGQRDACKDHVIRDPHVFSSMEPSRIVVVGQNPGWDELEKNIPFVGAAGRNFDAELATNGVSREQLYIANTVRCLRYNSRIMLGDGTLCPISKLVREHYTGEVLSLSGTKLVRARVVGWHKSDRAGRELYKVTYEGARRNALGAHGVTVTGDHKFLTTSGYVEASRLTKEHRLVIAEPTPNAVLSMVIYGTLLGDSSIPCKANALSCAHGPKQTRYCLYKMQLLRDFMPSPRRKSGRGFQFTTRAGLVFARLRKLKKTPVKLVDGSPITLAFWYMDDGYIGSRDGAVFCTDSFPRKEVDKLSKRLAKLGYKNSVFVVQSKYPRIRVWKADTVRLFAEIATYVPRSMRYKLLERFRSVPFTDLRQAVGVVDTMSASPVVTRVTHPERSYYCLDVEGTHNFLTSGGMVVHNCYTDFNAKPDAHTVARCAPFLQMEFNILNPKLVVALGAVAFSRLCPQAHYATNLGKVVKSEVYGLPVMPILHPSPLNLQQQVRRREFARQMKILCCVISRLTA